MTLLEKHFALHGPNCEAFLVKVSPPEAPGYATHETLHRAWEVGSDPRFVERQRLFHDEREAELYREEFDLPVTFGQAVVYRGQHASITRVLGDFAVGGDK